MHACSLYILNEVILQSLSQSCPLPTFCTLVHAPLNDVQNKVLNIVYAVHAHILAAKQIAILTLLDVAIQAIFFHHGAP